jgi:hypothetical protein
MLRLNCEISIGAYCFKYVKKVTVRRSWDEITDTSEIELPNFLKNLKEKVTIEEIKRSDPVEIKLGYIHKENNQLKNTLQTIFNGYVTTVKPDDVITVKCEDEMWNLKQRTIQKYAVASITLEDFIKYIWKETKLNIPYELIDGKANIGAWKISNMNVVQILFELRKFGLFAYFDDGTLKIDTPYDITLTEPEKKAKTKYFGFQTNIIDSNLDYRSPEDIDLVVHGISISSDNKKTELFTYVDNTGRTVTTNQKKEAEKGSQITWTTYGMTWPNAPRSLAPIGLHTRYWAVSHFMCWAI